MKVGVIDADLIGRKKQRFPNLVCMKLSSWHKTNGDCVELLLDYEDVENYDKVYIAKVFSDTEVSQEVLTLPQVEFGGTGFFYDKAVPLPYEIEHSKPDYSLYDNFVSKMLEKGVNRKELQYYTDYSIGFTTRGCIRGCSFCVNKNYKQCSLHSPVSEFIDESRKYICLLDDNVLACKDWKSVFQDLNASGKRFQFKQGMDERLLTDEKCEVVFSSNWIGDYIFAFDNIKDKELVERKLQLIRKYTDKIPKFYCFCGYNHLNPNSYSDEFWAKDVEDLMERIKVLMTYRALPYIMRYADYVKSPHKILYVALAGWCNQPNFFKKASFREYCANRKNWTNALNEFEVMYPDVAHKYFDMKWIKE